MKKKTTTNLEKARCWITGALKTGANVFFRFTDLANGSNRRLIYTEWMPAIYAIKEMKKRTEFNTFSVEMAIMS